MAMETGALDEIDRRILRRLQADGRASVQDISEGVGLSATATARRIRRLEDEGVIAGYRAILDEAALGYGVAVFVSVRLDRQIDGVLATFESAVRAFPEVVDCWLMTGNRDYLLRVATSSLAAFETFLTGKLTKVPGVASLESSIPLRRVKADLARTV